ncbi:MAG: peptidylprolyl isomerase [Candidatus Cloacimonetes bacterium]|nr:peptidylprolyl isomerase [Candidatus Cloacimonadota bacterium]
MKLHVTFFFAICLLLTPVIVQARSFARWHTSMGSFTAELYEEIVPITANNFTLLANNGFYNNKIFHRVIADFMIQDGCPYGTGYGGPGWTIQDEFSPLLLHDQPGILAMARTTAPNSAGSQYYITLAPTPHLDGSYAIFGKVIEGLDVVQAIGVVATGANDKPITPVNITQLRMLDLRINSVYPDTVSTISCSPGEYLAFMVEAYTNTAELTYSWYVNEVLQPAQNDMVFESSFAAGTNTLHCNISSSDSIAYDATWRVQSGVQNSDDLAPALSTPTLNCYPNPFSSTLELDYQLKQAAEVSFSIYNLKGQKVRSFVPVTKNAGTWKESWDSLDDRGKRCHSGTYIIRMNADKQTVIRKSYLVK